MIFVWKMEKKECNILNTFFGTLSNSDRNESKPAREETRNDLSVFSVPSGFMVHPYHEQHERN